MNWTCDFLPFFISDATIIFKSLFLRACELKKQKTQTTNNNNNSVTLIVEYNKRAFISNYFK